MNVVDYWDDKLKMFDLTASVIYLRNLGNFEWDKVSLLGCDGYIREPVCELHKRFSGYTRANWIRPLWFTGGPRGDLMVKGTLLALLIDRTLVVLGEQDETFVETIITYTRGFEHARAIAKNTSSSVSDSILTLA